MTVVGRRHVELNHTIVWCRDKQKSATFLVELLDLPAPTPFGPMLVVKLSNGVSLDFYENDGLPLRNLFTARQLRSRLPRWREGLDLLTLGIKIKLLRRRFRLGDVYAPPGRRAAGAR